MKARTLIWCWTLNEPAIIEFRGDTPHCPCCAGDLYHGDVLHTEMHVVSKPAERPAIRIEL